MSIQIPPGTAAERPDRSPPPSGRQLLTLFVGFMGLILAGIWLVGILANQLVWWIPHSVEQQLGRVTVPLFEPLAPPSTAQTELNQLLDQLEAHLPPDQQRRDYQVLFIPDATVNALAIPGDRIVIYEGLLTQMGSENELMMVLGHELGHFAHRDHLRGLGRSVVWQLTLAGLFGDLSSLQQIAAGGVERFSQAQYSQEQERQADEFGLELLVNTYGHSTGATDFFQRLARQRRVQIDFTASHPAPGQRVRRLQGLIRKRRYPQGQRVPLPDWAKSTRKWQN